jgi:hypothetical protein
MSAMTAEMANLSTLLTRRNEARLVLQDIENEIEAFLGARVIEAARASGRHVSINVPSPQRLRRHLLQRLWRSPAEWQRATGVHIVSFEGWHQENKDPAERLALDEFLRLAASSTVADATKLRAWLEEPELQYLHD